MKSKWDDGDKFLKKYPLEIDRVLDLVAKRELELRDLAVVYALERYCSWRSGRVRVTPKRLAERLAVHDKNVISSLSRLKAASVIRKAMDRDTGEWFYLFNPELVSVGPPTLRDHLRRVFQEEAAA